MNASTVSVGAPVRQIPPGPRGHPVFGTMFDIQKNMMTFLMGTARSYGHAARIRILPRWYEYIFTHPEHYKQVLVTKNALYDKQTREFALLSSMIGYSVVTSNGKYWVQQRRLALPSLRKEHINDYSKVMVRRAEGLLKRWRGYASSGDVIDGENEMTQLTVGIAGETLLGEDLDSRSQEVGRLFINANRYIAARFVRPLSPWTIHLPRPLNWSYNVTLKKIDNLLYEIIARRRRQPTAAPKDLLGVFLAAKDEETGQPLTDAQVRDEAITYLFAGHETSSTALTWIWYLLALHPEVEAQLHAELDQTLGGRSPTIDDLPALTYTKRVFEEALRFYPPGYVMSRRALEDDELGGYFIPKGAQVFLSPYVTHHHPEFWDQPEKFDPDRFLPERSANRHRFAYIPFGFGPRRCIGDGFATAEVQLLLATMAQRYRCRMANKEPLEIIPLVTIRPSKGLPMTLQVRWAT